jgi:hypothetical protein
MFLLDAISYTAVHANFSKTIGGFAMTGEFNFNVHHFLKGRTSKANLLI